MFAWQAQHLRTPYGHLKGWSAAGAALENPARPSYKLKRGRCSAWELRAAIVKVEALQAQRLRTQYGHLSLHGPHKGQPQTEPLQPHCQCWGCVDAIATKKWIPIEDVTWGKISFWWLSVQKVKLQHFKLPSNIEDGARGFKHTSNPHLGFATASLESGSANIDDSLEMPMLGFSTGTVNLNTTSRFWSTYKSPSVTPAFGVMAWTDPRSHAMPLAVPLTPNPLAGRKFYFVAGEMPPTSKLQILLSGTKCH